VIRKLRDPLDIFSLFFPEDYKWQEACFLEKRVSDMTLLRRLQ